MSGIARQVRCEQSWVRDEVASPSPWDREKRVHVSGVRYSEMIPLGRAVAMSEKSMPYTERKVPFPTVIFRNPSS
jgi:hypothetical protein